MVELSVVIAVYGCSECLAPLYKRLVDSLESVTSTFEIVFVDDCDNSDSWDILTALARDDARVAAYKLSRNFGQHAAITAGLAQCTGRWAVVMDCDLQDPPEKIPALYAKAQEGFDIVLTRRLQVRRPWYRKLATATYFRLLQLFSNFGADTNIGSFSILSRKVIDSFLLFQDRERHYLFILRWLGFNSTVLDYQQGERYSGRSSYGFRTLLIHALQGFFFQTTRLLRWVIYFGLFVSLSGVLLAVYFIYSYFVHTVYPGWTSLSVLILFFSGLIIVTLGITGLYISRIFEQVKARPLYVIAETTSKRSQ